MARFINPRAFLSPGLAALLTLVAHGSLAGAEEWRLEIGSGRTESLDLPVLVEAASMPRGVYALELPGRSAPTIAQVFGDSGKQYLASILPAASRPGAYALRPLAAAPPATEGFQMEPGGLNLSVSWHGGLIAEYHVDAGPKPFLFPVMGPTGLSYTRAFPMENRPGEDHDHPHQRSFWFTHGKVNGIDFWSEQGRHGSIRETARRCTVAGPVLARLCTSDDWIGPDGRKVCGDQRALTFYRTKRFTIIDFDVVIEASAGAVTFGDTKEGMFGLRVASSMDVDRRQGGKIVNAEGLADAQAWGKASPWVDYSGQIGGKTVGIAVLNHPRSFRFPTTWHVRTYGLFAANPFGWHDFGLGKAGDYTLPAGQSLTFSYRVILHEGDAAAAQIASAYDQFKEPPIIEVKGQ